MLLQLARPPLSPNFQILLFLELEVQICLGYHFQACSFICFCVSILDLLPTGLYKTNSSRQHNSSLLVLETRSPKSRYWQGRCLLGSLKESSRQFSSPSFGWLQSVGSLSLARIALACPSPLHMVLSSVFVFVSSCKDINDCIWSPA